jgi:MSHA biogenesis protein MshP
MTPRRAHPVHRCRARPGGRRAGGIALPAMIFAVVIVGLLLSAGLLLLTQSQHTQTLQLQAARALAAAKSGSEWGLWQVSDPDATQGLGAGTLPPCFASQTLNLPAPLADLPIQVSCTREPAEGSVDEGGLKLASYRVLAVASAGTSGSINFVQRQFEARVTVCKNPGASAPLYAC